MLLKDKVIAVTGSTKGIGLGIAKMLVEQGAKVAISGRDREAGENVKEEIIQMGGQAIFVPTDVSKPDDCYRLIDTTVERFGQIDGLVNNAGIFPHISLMDTDEKTFCSVMDVNIKGAFFCTQRALKYMKEQNIGSIVNIGTGHWNIGAKDLAAYACSKGALHTLTMHTAEHFATHHIRCNWVTVGWVWSPGELESMKQRGEDSEEVINKYIKECIPFGQIQSATDIGHACVYFLSDISNQVTASDIAATGGFRV